MNKGVNQRRLGSLEEAMAAQFLQQHGVHIIERNFHDSRFGEIDLIGWDRGVLVFIEVKYRSNLLHGRPEEAVTPAKQRTICQVAQYYIYRHHLSGRPVRFDVVAITKVDGRTEHLRWFRDAFPFQSR